jgi:outer membrane protein OmpU
MKNLLLASTALVMTAGVAAADVSVSGNGRMGITYNSIAANTMAFTSRIRATISMSGETDGGLSFGGSFGVHDAADAAAGEAGSIYISGAFGKLSMGDVSGAAESVVGDLHGAGLTGLGDLNELSYAGNVGGAFRPTARYDYTTGALTFAISTDNPSASPNTTSIGASYSADMYVLAAGYESTDAGTDQWYVRGDVSFDDTTVRGIFSDGTQFGQMYGVSLASSFGDAGLTAFYQNRGTSAYGVGMTYDLGGGANLAGGIVRTPFSATYADFGVKFTF